MPSKPAGSKVSSFFRYLAFVQIPSYGAFPSSTPFSAFAHVLVTSISSSFVPFFKGDVMSARYGAVQTVPQSIPFTRTVARLQTFPRFRYTGCPFLSLSFQRKVAL